MTNNNADKIKGSVYSDKEHKIIIEKYIERLVSIKSPSIQNLYSKRLQSI